MLPAGRLAFLSESGFSVTLVLTAGSGGSGSGPAPEYAKGFAGRIGMSSSCNTIATWTESPSCSSAFLGCGRAGLVPKASLSSAASCAAREATPAPEPREDVAPGEPREDDVALAVAIVHRKTLVFCN